MMAGTEVSEVGALEETCELGTGCYLDSIKPDCNGISHHSQTKNFNVIETGADRLNDDSVNIDDVIAGNLGGLPKSNSEFEDEVAGFDDRNEKLDAVGGEVSEQSLRFSPKSNSEVENQVTESNNQDEKLDVVNREATDKDLSGSPKSYSEVEDQVAESDQDEKLDAVNGDTSEQDLSGSPKTTAEVEDQVAESDDQNEKLDAVNGKANEQLNEGKAGNVMVADDYPPLVNGNTLENGNGFQVYSVNSTSNGKTKSWMEVAISVPTRSDVKVKPRVYKPSDISSGKMNVNFTDTSRKEVSNSFHVKNNVASNIVADRLDGAGNSKEKLHLQVNGDTGNCPGNDISTASPESSIADVIDEEEVNVEAVTNPFNYMIKVPRFDDRSLQEHINLAKLEVDEKTKLRDAIQVQIQEKRVIYQLYDYAKGEEREARRLVKSKRMEIDSLLSVISKAKNALSIDDISSQIRKMEHMIQHETIPLKQEKQLIREIKQLKQLHEQLSSNMGSKDEMKEALEQREEVEERLKILRKELDILKDGVLKAEAAAVEAKKKYDAENKKIKELQANFRAANDVRQASYVQLQSLRKELAVRNKHFFKYKDDAAAANNYASSGNKKALHSLCTNQVEKFLELWNTNNKFRQDYVKFNARSTIRRFGTLDARSLGPDKKSPILPSYDHERVDRTISTPSKVDLESQSPTLGLKQETTVKNMTSDGKLLKKMTEHRNHKFRNKKPNEPSLKNGLVMVPGRFVTDEVQEEPKKSKEETRLSKKAKEMLREEETVAKTKEQRRLEELAKAEVAQEKKKQEAEKAQMRAELKAQNEAEEKEKERQKRLRKNEKKKEKKREKKAISATDISDINNCETVPSTESAEGSSKGAENEEVPSMIPKQPQPTKPVTNTKSFPLPLNNRNKKSYRQFMWTCLTGLVVYILFWVGNVDVLSNLRVDWRSLQ